VLLDGAQVGAHTTISGSIVGPAARIGEDCRIEGLAVLGEGVVIGRDNVVAAGARIFPGVQLPDGGIRF
jgi:mannose-1-phosphate guanylyltransferase